MPTNADYTREYFEITKKLDGDIASRRKAFSYMKNSTAIYHDEVVDYVFMPRLFNQETFQTFEHTTTMTHSILCKVIQKYLDDPEYRKAFDFDDRFVELILLPRGYDAALPFARFDVFLDEDTQTVRFCEFNGDGSSGMNENREITSALVASESYQMFSQKHTCTPCELVDSWIKEFMDIYATYIHKKDDPHVAMCDYLENAVIDEFKIFSDAFKKQGVECSIYDVRDLTFDGSSLHGPDGKRVDAIWRRCVTNNVLENWDASQALIEAVRAEKVALIGSFAGHIVHDKQIFEVLLDSRTTAFLTAEEISFLQQTIPLTRPLDKNYVNLTQIKENKNEWLIKPTDNYGATDVFAGKHHTSTDWTSLIDRYANAATGQPFLLQEYCTPYQTQTLTPDNEIESLSDEEVDTALHWYNNLSGLYCYNGAFTGVFSRLGPLPTISKSMQGVTTATIWVD